MYGHFTSFTTKMNDKVQKCKDTAKYMQKTYLAPIESIVQMNGLFSSLNPAITGWQKYGPNLRQINQNPRSVFLELTNTKGNNIKMYTNIIIYFCFFNQNLIATTHAKSNMINHNIHSEVKLFERKPIGVVILSHKSLFSLLHFSILFTCTSISQHRV